MKCVREAQADDPVPNRSVESSTQASHDTEFVMARLVATWAGRGTATYPDVPAIPYLERTTITREPDWNMLSILQRTWQDDRGRRGEGLHLEAGIIRALPDGRLEYSCAQDSGRTEVMVGSPLIVGDALTIEWITTEHSNDERLVRMGRSWQVESRHFSYRAHVATRRTPEFRQHLDAVLLRTDEAAE